VRPRGDDKPGISRHFGSAGARTLGPRLSCWRNAITLNADNRDPNDAPVSDAALHTIVEQGFFGGAGKSCGCKVRKRRINFRPRTHQSPNDSTFAARFGEVNSRAFCSAVDNLVDVEH
jgi:hypothetical protein